MGREHQGPSVEITGSGYVSTRRSDIGPPIEIIDPSIVKDHSVLDESSADGGIALIADTESAVAKGPSAREIDERSKIEAKIIELKTTAASRRKLAEEHLVAVQGLEVQMTATEAELKSRGLELPVVAKGFVARIKEKIKTMKEAGGGAYLLEDVRWGQLENVARGVCDSYRELLSAVANGNENVIKKNLEMMSRYAHNVTDRNFQFFYFDTQQIAPESFEGIARHEVKFGR